MRQLLNRKTVLYFIFPMLTGWGVQAQTCNTIAGGSYFEALYEDGQDFRELSATKKIEPSCWTMTTPLPYAQANTDFGTEKVYGVVDNPHNVNSAFLDIDEPMMLISGIGTLQSLFFYQLSELIPDTVDQQCSITIEGYFLNSASSSCVSKFQTSPPTFNLRTTFSDNTVASQNWLPWTDASPHWEEKFTFTTTRNLAAGETKLHFEIRTGSNWDECLVLGISKIETFYNVKIKSSAGTASEVCAGEQIRFTLDREYNATTYQWEKSPDSTGPWTPVGGNAKTILDEVKETTWYRCKVDGFRSEVLKMTTVNCCEIRPGIASSRKTIYHDNFGTFSSQTNYVDAFGTTRPAKNWQTSSMPYTIPGHNPVFGTPNDGQYIISTLRPNVMGNWMRGGMSEDASGDPNGGVLVINVNYYHSPANPPYYGEIYRHQMNDICPDVNLYFEVYIANASVTNNTEPPNVTISMLTTGGTVLGSTNSNLTHTTRGWQRVTIPPFATSETSVVLQIVSNNTCCWEDGVDLLMDDVSFRICTPPVVELYSNLSDLTQDMAICDRHDNNNITLATQVSELVSKYYNDEPRFLYQASTNNGTTWKNISGIVPESSYIHSLNDYKSGTYVYFRMLIASEGELNKFIANPAAEDETNCKTVSISDPIKIYVDELLNGKITANTPICKGNSVTINAGYNADTYIWTSPAFNDKKETAEITESPAETTTYNLYVSRGECEATNSVTIEVKSRPVILLIDSLGVRDKEIVPDSKYGTPPFIYGVDEKPADDNPVKSDLSFTKHSFYITDALGCRSDDYVTEAPKLYPSTCFTPNGDGFNDTWEVPGMRDMFPNAVVSIYDRFGKQIIRYKGADTGWNGACMGKQMPSTDYWYIIDIEEINEQYIGHFTLLRR